MTHFVYAMSSFFSSCGATLKTSSFLHFALLWNYSGLCSQPSSLPCLNSILITIFYVILLICCFLVDSPLKQPLLMMLRYVDFHACSHYIKIIKNLIWGSVKIIEIFYCSSFWFNFVCGIFLKLKFKILKYHIYHSYFGPSPMTF